MRHHVLIATTPERHTSFQQVLRCLEEQVKRPDRIWICYDADFDHSDWTRWSFAPEPICFVSEIRGNGVHERWDPVRNFTAHADDMIEDDDLVTIMDDDWFVDMMYLKNCHDQWCRFRDRGLDAVIGWMGWITNAHTMAASVSYPCDTPLAYATGGLLTGSGGQFRAAWESAPKVKSLWGDDLALSVGLHRSCIHRIRPKGWSHAIELPSHRGKEALQNTYREDMLRGVRDLFNVYGVDAL